MTVIRTAAYLVLAAAIIVAARVAWEVLQFTSPPYACQVLGGSWSLFNGWSCL